MKLRENPHTGSRVIGVQTDTAVVVHIHILPHSYFSVTTSSLVFEAIKCKQEESLNKLRRAQTTQKWNGETNGCVRRSQHTKN